MTTLTSSFASNDGTTQWFKDSLQCLGHDDPSVITTALMQSSEEEDTADTAFRQISLWLEDRIIRQWDMKARNGLRKDFWLSLVDYLQGLDCPSEYYADDEWRCDPRRRTRVMYWLISSAISEVHEEKCCNDAQKQGTDDDNDATPSNYESPSSTKGFGNSESRNNLASFPLGFTTNDPQVDRALTYIRMQHVLQLRQEQDQINIGIAQLQTTSVAKAKPLKARKKR